MQNKPPKKLSLVPNKDGKQDSKKERKIAPIIPPTIPAEKMPKKTAFPRFQPNHQ